MQSGNIGQADLPVRDKAPYRLPDHVWQSVTARMAARHNLHGIMNYTEAWVSEMERFVALKAMAQDHDASKLSPSGML